MAEIRLNKIIKQFNIGLGDLVDFLHKIGADVDENPNAKISDEYLPAIEKQFGWDLIEYKKQERKEPEEEQKIATKKAETLTQPEQKKLISPDEFDWDSFERGDVYGRTSNETIPFEVIENEVVEGEVVAINKREVVVSVGARYEGILPISEFRYNPDLKVGDKVDVYVESAEDRKGQLVLSHRKARALKSWDRVNEAFDNEEIVKGYVKARTKGGLIVDIFGIEAFLPGSQIDTKPVKDYDQFVDQTIDLKITKINREFRNVVVSHKILLETEQGAKRSELIGGIKKDQVTDDGSFSAVPDASEDFDWGVFEG